MKTQNLILHIPHSSRKIPYYNNFILPREELETEINLLTDWYTDELFDLDNTTRVVADFSRIFCDPERFADDEKENMSKVGMGVLYETTDDGRKMREVTPELKQQIIREFYNPHHTKLKQAVKAKLKTNATATIVDCHSFTDFPLKRDVDQNKNRPDICIGSDNFHTPESLVIFSKMFFEKYGLSVKINSPYSGAIVPLDYYGENARVQSIMIEINRKLYLSDKNIKSSNFDFIKDMIHSYLLELINRY